MILHEVGQFWADEAKQKKVATWGEGGRLQSRGAKLTVIRQNYKKTPLNNERGARARAEARKRDIQSAANWKNLTVENDNLTQSM